MKEFCGQGGHGPPLPMPAYAYATCLCIKLVGFVFDQDIFKNVAKCVKKARTIRRLELVQHRFIARV